MSITGGNWKVGQIKSTVVTDDLTTADFVSRDSEDSIKYYGGALVAESCREADAKLIAAAPCMLEALQSIVDYWNTPQKGSMNDHIGHSIKLAEAAIKKATE